jgi:hypothetical protein
MAKTCPRSGSAPCSPIVLRSPSTPWRVLWAWIGSARSTFLGIREGTTENRAVCSALLSGLVERGLDALEGILVVIDGGKGLSSAVREVFGNLAPVQRHRRARGWGLHSPAPTTPNWLGQPCRELHLPAQPGRHPGHGSPRDSYLGPRRISRQFPVGSMGSRSRWRAPAAGSPAGRVRTEP